MSLTNRLVPAYAQMLRALSGWLEKAQKHSIDNPDSLLSARLASDMYPLATQIRFVCVQALEPVYRLRGEPLPALHAELTQEGFSGGNSGETIADAQARINTVLALLEGLAPDALDDGETRKIALEMPNGVIFDLTGQSYVRDWSQPQFYFHLMAAYAILRHCGVDLGKADYVPHMFAYIRPGTMPG